MGARDRKPPGGAARERARQPLDHDTKKISASQLAEVLARIDGEGESKPPEPRRTISGTRPIIRPAIRPRSDSDRSSPTPETAEAIDIPEGRLAPIIERPVHEGHVVNATAPLRPPSSGELAAPVAIAIAIEGTSAIDSSSAIPGAKGGQPEAGDVGSEMAVAVLVPSPRRAVRGATIVLVSVLLALAAAFAYWR